METSAPAGETWTIDLGLPRTLLPPGITQLSMFTVITQFHPEFTLPRDWTFLKKTRRHWGKK